MCGWVYWTDVPVTQYTVTPSIIMPSHIYVCNLQYVHCTYCRHTYTATCTLYSTMCTYSTFTVVHSAIRCMHALHPYLTVHSLKVGVVHRLQGVGQGSKYSRRLRRFASTSSGTQRSSESATATHTACL